MRSTARSLRFVTAIAVLTLVVAACSGGGETTATATGGPTTANPAPAASGPAVTGGATTPAGTATKGTATAAGTATTASGTTGSGGKATTKGGATYKPATLFTAQEDRIGISTGKITLCLHAALSLAEAFDTRVEDLREYWKMVNAEQKGVYGRQVEIFLADDRYGAANGARDAYEECKGHNPFILLGGIGFDQIPAIRALAEQDHQLYVHHIARQDLKKKYSFSFLPSVETVGRRAGEWILAAHPGKKIGVVWRQSENWEPGHKTFLAALSARGVKPVADVPVTQNQSVYTAQVKTLQDSGAQVVFIWENVLAGTEIIKQAKQQNYSPVWVNFPFNTMTDTLGDDALQPPVEGVATWPAYAPGKYDGPFARYASDIKAFEAAHAKYGDSRSKANDILWMTWLGMKQTHQLLLQCGKDCTRNKIVGLLQSGVHEAAFPLCPIDFTRNGHVAGFDVTIFTAFKRGSGAAWQETQVCKRHF